MTIAQPGQSAGARSRWIIGKSEVVAHDGMVATMYPQATDAGLAMLEAGGNAVDAAVAAAFAVGVVEPFNSGLGGIAQLVYFEASTGRSYVVDGIPTLPVGLRPALFQVVEGGGTAGVYGWPMVKGDANNTGFLAPAVPGVPACLCTALERFGCLSRPRVMAPAIELAERGYLLDWYVALAMACGQERLQRFPESRRTFFKPGGACYRAPMLGMAADRFVQPDLAESLRLVAREGADVFYRGVIGRRIAQHLTANGGVLSEAEIAAFEAPVLEPGLRGSYRGYDLIQAPHHTGAPTALQALNILEGYNLAALGHNRVEALHLVVEALRLAFLDRFGHLGDPAQQPVPHNGLVSKGYAAQLRAGIDPARAHIDAAAGNPWAFEAADAEQTALRGPSAAANPDRAGAGQTTHITVVDRERNMVALTATLGSHFGSAVVVPSTGITLNNAAMWFDPTPGSVNSIGPGKRIIWAGTPTLLLQEGKPFFAVGAPGGRKIISAVVQSILNVVDYGLGAQDAVAAPRVHCEGRETLVDAALGSDTADGLRRLGHQVTVVEETFSTSHFARPNGVLVDRASGTLRGGVNQYKPATAAGL